MPTLAPSSLGHATGHAEGEPPSRLSEFPGLNGLRALAALFVVIGHIPLNQGAVGLRSPSWGAFFFRGQPAVLFFFTLSGFLITHLLLQEVAETGTISIARFYLRRVLRIWPLYFAVVGLGLLVYKWLLPNLGIHHAAEYPVPLALALYTFFLPNLMNSLYSVGGILNPLWSIGIEEQFYLAWAPAVRRWRRHMPILCAAVFLAFVAVFVGSELGVFGAQRGRLFSGQLKFHFMAAGGLSAWMLRAHRSRLLDSAPFKHRGLQGLLFGALAWFYLVGFGSLGAVGEELCQVLLYTWLVVNTAANPRRLVAFSSPLLDRLGRISFGIYMLHMPAVYVTSALFRATPLGQAYLPVYLAAYYALAISLTLTLAAISYRFFETPFLRLKKGLSAPPRSLDGHSEGNALPSPPLR